MVDFRKTEETKYYGVYLVHVIDHWSNRWHLSCDGCGGDDIHHTRPTDAQIDAFAADHRQH